MSTSETDEYAIGKCACGHGKVIKTMVTQDNPWSGADIFFRLECSNCPGTWDLDRSGQQMTLRSSLVAPRKANDALMAARQKLHEYQRALASACFATTPFKTKKAEYEYLHGLGIANGSYRTYLQDRKGGAMHQVAALYRNSVFVENLVNEYGDRSTYNSLQKAIDEADSAYKIAASAIVKYQVR